MGLVFLSENDLRAALNSFKKVGNSSQIIQWYWPTWVLSTSSMGTTTKRLCYCEGYELVRGSLKNRSEAAIQVANNHGVALAGVGDLKTSKTIYKSILDADARNVSVLYNYASLLIQKFGEPKAGREVLSRLKFVADSPAIQKKAQRLMTELEELEAKK